MKGQYWLMVLPLLLLACGKKPDQLRAPAPESSFPRTYPDGSTDPKPAQSN